MNDRADANAGATDAVSAVQAGDVDALRSLLAADASLAKAYVDAKAQRTLLHVATDWPGHFANVAAVIRVIVDAGADVNAAFAGPKHKERPLHWAASSDDVAALDALLDAGADIEAPGSIIGDGTGTALADAVAFAQWQCAKRLVERGAAVTLWQAAALGLNKQLATLVATSSPTPTKQEITNALWNACHGGQLASAKHMVDCGADIDWVGHGGLTALGAAQRRNAADVVAWLESLGAK